MKYNNKPVLTDLYARLRQVLPQYKPISEMKLGETGTWKAVDSDGNVYLVSWGVTCDKTPTRKSELVFDYQTLLRQSGQSKSYGPEDNWILEESF